MKDTTRMSDAAVSLRLGGYLRERRARLDPVALGLPAGRRRTPGLRREEVAQRASISPTWYTWLEQGRGGAPSAEVLERISRALMLNEFEREHVFLLGLGRPPEVRYRGEAPVAPRLQRLLDALDPVPALIRTATWDVAAWNRGATVFLSDYGRLPPQQRNIVRAFFLDPRVRAMQHDWGGVARYVVGAFRAEAARAGATEAIAPMVAELGRISAEFAAIWSDNDLPAPVGEVVKQIHHPVLGTISFEYTALAVDGRADLTMVVYNPAGEEDARRIAAAVAAA